MNTHFTKALAIALTIGITGAFTPAFAQKTNEKPAVKTTAPKAPKATNASPKAAAKSKKISSPCKGLNETQCAADTQCGWVKPTKAASSDGKKLKSYCRKMPAKAKKS